MVNVLKKTELEYSQEKVAELLIYPLWKSIDDSYKERYKREIWEHFENALRSAAYTAKLTIFLSNFKNRIPSTFELQNMKSITSIVESGLDSEILNWLRDETTYLVMLARLKNQDKKDAYKERQLLNNDCNNEESIQQQFDKM